MLEIHYCQLFSNIAYLKACFKAHIKIQLPFFYIDQALLTQRRPWLWSIYCITVLLDTTSMHVLCVHIAGVNNEIVDCLSHFQQDKFRRLVPLAHPVPDNIPVWSMQSFTDTSWNAAILAYLLQHVELINLVLMPSLSSIHSLVSLHFQYYYLHLNISVPRHLNMSHTRH